MMLMLATGDLRIVFWVAVAPAFAAVMIILFSVHEPSGSPIVHQHRGSPFRQADVRRLPGSYWFALSAIALFSMARFSGAFLLLRARDAGWPIASVPVVMVTMNAVYATGAYPLGAASDRVKRGRLLCLGVAALFVADLSMALATSWPLVLVGASLWGLHMAATQGLLSALVADAAPENLRGAAFGAFNLVEGVVLLAASYFPAQK